MGWPEHLAHIVILALSSVPRCIITVVLIDASCYKRCALSAIEMALLVPLQQCSPLPRLTGAWILAEIAAAAQASNTHRLLTRRLPYQAISDCRTATAALQRLRQIAVESGSLGRATAGRDYMLAYRIGHLVNRSREKFYLLCGLLDAFAILLAEVVAVAVLDLLPRQHGVVRYAKLLGFFITRKLLFTLNAIITAAFCRRQELHADQIGMQASIAALRMPSPAVRAAAIERMCRGLEATFGPQLPAAVEGEVQHWIATLGVISQSYTLLQGECRSLSKQLQAISIQALSQRWNGFEPLENLTYTDACCCLAKIAAFIRKQQQRPQQLQHGGGIFSHYPPFCKRVERLQRDTDDRQREHALPKWALWFLEAKLVTLLLRQLRARLPRDAAPSISG